MRVKYKEPLRPPKKYKKEKKERRGHTTIHFERSTLVQEIEDEVLVWISQKE